jgi:hypothetical protein
VLKGDSCESKLQSIRKQAKNDAPEKHKSKGWTNAMPKTNEAKKATCTNVRTA